MTVCPSAAYIDSGMFLFFSNRLGCLGSLGVTLIGTVIVLLLAHVI